MERVLREWFYGNIIPIEGIGQAGEEEEKRENVYCSLLELFEEKIMALNLREEYEEMELARLKYDLERESELFSCAFCLGARIMLEVLDPHMVF